MKTLKETSEHPGQKIYQINKKILKTKAEEELRESFKAIFERRMVIMETIIGMKGKIYEDVQKMRVKEMFGKKK